VDPLKEGIPEVLILIRVLSFVEQQEGGRIRSWICRIYEPELVVRSESTGAVDGGQESTTYTLAKGFVSMI
jgi:hypothetical protein